MPDRRHNQSIWYKLHIDFPLLFGLLSLMGVSLVVLYSAGGADIALMKRQVIRMFLALGVMLALAQIPPSTYRRWAFPIFLIGTILLIAVLLFGHVGKGAQRWIDLGFTKFQPSEIMKVVMPLAVARYMSNQPIPPSFRTVISALIMVLIPTLLIAKQPDLGTSLLVAISGIFVIFLAGMSWRLVMIAVGLVSGFAPILWFFLMRPYQKQRVLTFLNPESDPLGSGYHIIQSKIAIGSGGFWGKGWLSGTQSQLDFLPERHTDFIFAVFSEEFGLFGVILLLSLYLFVICRGLVIAMQGQRVFERLIAGSITMTFFIYLFVNIGMVSGLLPVVGVPLPLISYGGTSMVTLMAGFGILMSVRTHRRLS
ncbi:MULTISPECIES: rod shape-determining protein RodA [unclassified Moritella]|uniref:rod shape-determining protein RodA n=1 Tax=unclassified Moritella TaxID=2637987 RepID=UPI001BA62019|nr:MULTISPECIES: rod shape-determining protein RodA [unclassified Moritella]QUM86544.1 rod shape-determining protein RodA [Moritella sp. 28]QUM90770.1 rod shape-determining protein RodA [Moritella sp. 36]